MTFNSVPEAVGVARAAAAAGLSASISFTLDSNHRLHSGPTLREAIEPASWFQRVRCLRPNAAMMDKIALCTLGHLESGDPVDLGQRMGQIAQQHPHIDIWGGCCGTWETHLDEIARTVSTSDLEHR